MLVFALMAAGIGLALTVLSMFLPPVPGQAADVAPQGSVSMGGEPQVPSSSAPLDRPKAPQAAVLRLVGMPLLTAGLVAATLVGLGRPFLTTLGVGLALGLPVGLVGALIVNRTQASPE